MVTTGAHFDRDLPVVVGPELVTPTVVKPDAYDGAAAGALQVICVELTTVTLDEGTVTTDMPFCPPNWTDAPARKFVPVMVTAVPPVLGPELGATLVTV